MNKIFDTDSELFINFYKWDKILSVLPVYESPTIDFENFPYTSYAINTQIG